MKTLKLGIIGVDILEIEALLDVLAEESFEFLLDIELYDTRSQVNKRVVFGGDYLTIKEMRLEFLATRQIVIFLSKIATITTLQRDLEERGVVCINMSVNPISTILGRLLYSLNSEFKIDHVFLNTIEGVSSEGKLGFEVLESETSSFFGSQDLKPHPSALYSSALAYNIIPLEQTNEDSLKIKQELCSIANISADKIFLQRVKAPIFVGVGGNVFASFERAIGYSEIISFLRSDTIFCDDLATDVDSEDVIDVCLPSFRHVHGTSRLYFNVGVSDKKSKEHMIYFCADPLRFGIGQNCVSLIKEAAKKYLSEK